MTLSPTLRSRFRGCLVGAVVGDCIGAPFEVTGVGGPGSYDNVQDFVNKFDVEIDGPGKLEYTDDTAMARCVAESLIANNGQLEAKDLAKRFADEYMAHPTRGYGYNVVTVLKRLGDRDLSDVFAPARNQFDGGGSYGNGGAMRVAPVALCGEDEVERVIQNAKSSALLTHSNRNGYNGAVLQALAVHQALHTATDKMNREKFAENLLNTMREKVECQTSDEGTANDNEKEAKLTTLMSQVKKRKVERDDVYCQRLESLCQFLKSDPPAEEVASVLGNSISAHNSVGSALYSFLRCLNPVEGLYVQSPMERTILYAISLDGDTDTIASMAGAIAGAFHGIESIPEQWQKLCEGSDTALKQADRLYEILTKAKTER
ncbi:ADP-ribosylhydrolase ARH3-like isoform X2 [Apostichopus japonicus]